MYNVLHTPCMLPTSLQPASPYHTQQEGGKDFQIALRAFFCHH